MSDVTQILSAIDQGDPHAAEQLLPWVYAELRKLAAQKLAHEKPGHTLDATALVHEAYLRLATPPQGSLLSPGGPTFLAEVGPSCMLITTSSNSSAKAAWALCGWRRVRAARIIQILHPFQLDIGYWPIIIAGRFS
jgi:hypothetical protein